MEYYLFGREPHHIFSVDRATITTTTDPIDKIVSVRVGGLVNTGGVGGDEAEADADAGGLGGDSNHSALSLGSISMSASAPVDPDARVVEGHFSPAHSSLSGSNSTSAGSSGTNGNGVPSLLVVRQPPSHEFGDCWMECALRVEVPAPKRNGRKKPKREKGADAASTTKEEEAAIADDTTVEVRAELCRYDAESGKAGEVITSDAPPEGGSLGSAPPELILDPPPLAAVSGDGDGDGTTIRVPVVTVKPGEDDGLAQSKRPLAVVRFKIRSEVLTDKVTAYCVKFTALPPPPPPMNDEVSPLMMSPKGPMTLAQLLAAVQPGYTNPITMVSSKISVTADEWEPLWYKDEGGRDKCMTVVATLLDRNNLPDRSRPRRVPLKLTLMYNNDSQTRVLRQEILRVMGTLKKYIDPGEPGESGDGMSPGGGGGGCSSTALQFRIEDVSKNHQGMDFTVQVSADVRTAADVAPGYSPVVSVRSKRNKRQRSSAAGRESAMSVATTAATTGVGGWPPSSEAARQAAGSTPTIPAAAAHVSVAARPRSPLQGYSQPPPGPRAASSGQPQEHQGFTGVTDVSSLRRSMRGIIQWTEEVVNGLHPLKWQIIGYAQFPDGSVDYNRPYHSMPNPNEVVGRVLGMYSDETRDHLRALLTAVENTRPDPNPNPGGQGGQGLEPSSAYGSSRPEQQPPPYGAPPAGGPPPHPPQHMQAPGQPPIGYPPSDPYGSTATQHSAYGGHAAHRGWGGEHSQPMHHQGGPPPPPGGLGRGSSGGAAPPPPAHQHGHSPYGQYPPPSHQQGYGNPYPGAGPPPSKMARTGGYTSTPPGGATAARAHGGQHPNMQPPPRAPHAAAGAAQAQDQAPGGGGEADVEYVLAKQFKSLRTGSQLGFPAYSSSRLLLGFYRESSSKAGVGQFVPLSAHADEFGPAETEQATRILDEAANKGSPALHALRDWGSVANLVDHALVYDWSKDIGGSGGGNGNGK